MFYAIVNVAVLVAWWLLMRARGRAEAQHRAALEGYISTIRALDEDHAARNAAFLRAIGGLQAARVLPTHQPAARPS